MIQSEQLRTVGGAVIALAACLVLAACEDPSATGPAPSQGAAIGAWLEYFDSHGELDGVSDEERAVLESAAESGELTYDDVTGLIQLVFECVEEQGLHAEWQAPHEDYGFPVPAYAIAESSALGTEANQAVIDECTNRYSALAEQLYIWQPKNAAIEAAKWSRDYRDPMIQCLRDNGVEVDDDATRSEIEAAALELNQPTGPPDDPVFGVNCFPPS